MFLWRSILLYFPAGSSTGWFLAFILYHVNIDFPNPFPFAKYIYWYADQLMNFLELKEVKELTSFEKSIFSKDMHVHLYINAPSVSLANYFIM